MSKTPAGDGNAAVKPARWPIARPLGATNTSEEALEKALYDVEVRGVQRLRIADASAIPTTSPGPALLRALCVDVTVCRVPVAAAVLIRLTQHCERETRMSGHNLAAVLAGVEDPNNPGGYRLLVKPPQLPPPTVPAFGSFGPPVPNPAYDS